MEGIGARTLAVGRLQGERWVGCEGIFIELIERGGVDRVDLTGFCERFGWVPDYANTRKVIRALAASKVTKIEVGFGDEWFAFADAEFVCRALKDETVRRNYCKRLTAFDASWALGDGPNDGSAWTALQILKEMPHVDSFCGGDLTDGEGADELLDVLFERCKPERLNLGKLLTPLAHKRIAAQLKEGLSGVHERYLEAQESLDASQWPELAEDDWLALVELTPNAQAVNLQALSPKLWTDALASALEERERVVPPMHCELDFRSGEWGPAALCVLATKSFIKLPDHRFSPKLAKQLAKAMRRNRSLRVEIAWGTPDVPRLLLRALAARKEWQAVIALADPTDERIEELKEMGIESLRLTGNIGLTGRGWARLAKMHVEKIWFSPDRPEIAQPWTSSKGAWNVVVKYFAHEVHSLKKRVWEPELKGLNWAQLKKDPTLLNGPQHFDDSNKAFVIHFVRKMK